ncbi:hypothetical protein BT93_K0234 [Corymbia citriodora subsp. variegata]|nr:hypothetical protein BT93_K0234 [Corymbia citriodora subsp. variegata]
MASMAVVSYQRLRDEGPSDEEDEEEVKEFRRTVRWPKFRRFTWKPRPKVQIPRQTRFLRKKMRLLSRVRLSWRRTWERLKKNRAHMNDLFAANYMFMNLGLAPFNCKSIIHS